MAVIDLKFTNLYVRDGGLNYLSIRLGDGALTYTTKRLVQLKKTRGKLASVREDNEEGMEVSFQFLWEFLTSSGSEPPTIQEALYNEGAATSWKSASFDPNAPYSVHLQLVWLQTCRQPNGAFVTQGEVYTFPEFNPTDFTYSPKDNTVDCKGICNSRRPVITRVSS